MIYFMEGLFEWAKNNGTYINPKLQLNKDEKFINTEVINVDEVLIKIPKNILLGENEFKKLPNMDLYKDDEFFKQKENKIIISLLYHKTLGSSSFYYPYISNLPKLTDMKMTPLLCSNDELKDIWDNISPTFSKMLETYMEYILSLKDQIIEINKKYKIINTDPKIFGENIKEDEIIYLLSLWTFLIYNRYALDNTYLIPFFDCFYYNNASRINMFNHENEIVIKYEGINEIQPNSLLMLNNIIYDHKRFLSLYGYIPTTKIKFLNININIDIIKKKRYLADKIQGDLQRYNFENKKFYLTNIVPTQNLLNYLRIISLTESDLQIIGNIEKYFENFISIENEMTVYKYLLQIIEKLKETPYNLERKDIAKQYINDDDVITSCLSEVVLEEYDILDKSIIWIHKQWLSFLSSYNFQELIGLDEKKNF